MSLCVLLVLPKEQVSGLQGVMQAVQTMAGKAGVPWLVPILAALVTLNTLGAVAGWFAATARLLHMGAGRPANARPRRLRPPA